MKNLLSSEENKMKIWHHSDIRSNWWKGNFLIVYRICICDGKLQTETWENGISFKQW